MTFETQSMVMVIVGAVALIPAIDTVRRWFVGDSRTIGPQPLEVRESKPKADRDHDHTEFQRAANCSSLHASIKTDMDQIEDRHSERTEALRKEIKADIAAVLAAIKASGEEAESRSSKIHSRIDPLSNVVAATNQRMEDHLRDHRAGLIHTTGGSNAV
jgi:hypothetical protein